MVAEREFAAGDRVVCLRNSDALGVKNGTCGTVERDRPEQSDTRRRHRPRPDRRAEPELSRGGQRPPCLCAYRPRRAGPHGRARLRPRLRRGPTPGMGLRRALPGTSRDPPLRHRHAPRTRKPLPRPRRPRPARPLRPRTRRVSDRGARSRSAPLAVRATATRPDPRSNAQTPPATSGCAAGSSSRSSVRCPRRTTLLNEGSRLPSGSLHNAEPSVDGVETSCALKSSSNGGHSLWSTISSWRPMLCSKSQDS